MLDGISNLSSRQVGLSPFVISTTSLFLSSRQAVARRDL